MSPIPSTTPDAAVGLFTRETRQPIPLDHVRVEAHVVDLCARVTIHQAYRNREDVPLEVVYVFPLDEGAAVCGFEATVDGVRFVGQVKERDEAFREYDDALEAGHGGFLLDEERADVFTASLGNMKPGSEVVLSITYVTELAAEGAAARFTLPTTVSPRYAPAQDLAGVGPTPADILNPPVALEVPYAFTFEMDLAMGGRISGVQSPTHPIEVELDGTSARVRLAQRSAPMDRDLVVVVSAEGLDVPHAVVERGERGGALLLSFVPKFETSSQAAEVIFVIDRSGSMGGTSIAEVRNALQLCLRSLSPGCRFNIVSFGSRYEAFFPESRVYDDESMKKAAAFVGSLDADMGGTELLAALEYVVGEGPMESRPSMWQAVRSFGGTRRSASREGGLPRQILLLTDGEVTNTDEIIDLVRRHASTTRFFTFGIGAGASHHLVRGIARASGGAAEFISPGERIEAKVMRQFKRVLLPALTDVKVDWGQRGATPASDHVPPVFDGERLVVYALADAPRAGTATLAGVLAGRAVKFEVRVDPDLAVAGDTIATLAARARIRTLEEQGEYLESRGSLQRRGRATAKAAAEIAALGVEYQLCSRETSFVAIEHRETPVAGRAELRRVPVALTSGWGALPEQDATGSFRLSAAARMAPASTHQGTVIGFSAPYGGDSAAARSGDGPFDGAFSESFEGTLDADAAPAAHGPFYRVAQVPREEPLEPAHAPRDLDRLVALQSADGSWDLTPEFAEIIGRSLDELEAELRGAPGGRAVARRVAATSLALEWLEREATAERVEWEMLAEKARRWLAGHGASPVGSAPTSSR
jgi:hypothetical protein